MAPYDEPSDEEEGALPRPGMRRSVSGEDMAAGGDDMAAVSDEEVQHMFWPSLVTGERHKSQSSTQPSTQSGSEEDTSVV